jgi:Coenzyme PQQ synthesis protein D (PqqD)
VPELSLETVVVRRAEPLTASVDGELVMLDPQRSHYFAIDSIGSRVWELLERPVAVEELCTTLEGEFDVAPETCRTDVLAFLEELRQAELLDVR